MFCFRDADVPISKLCESRSIRTNGREVYYVVSLEVGWPCNKGMVCKSLSECSKWAGC